MNYKIIGKYIKNLNFNIPDSKSFSLLAKDIPSYKININIQSNQIKEKVIEIDTSLKLKPINNNNEKITTEIMFTAIIELDQEIKDKKEVEKIILIDVPTEIYPELRKVFVFVFENSGFREIKIDPNVDFKKLYLSRQN